MDRVYRRQRYIYDVTRRYYLFGRDRLIRELALAPGDAVVEVGCGTARNLIKIAQRYPGAQLYGLDASAEMLDTAAQNIARHDLKDRIRLVHGYAEELGPELFGRQTGFDRILFPYSLSMIPDWRRALAAAGQALAPAGRLHAVDFGDLTGLGPIAGDLLRAWLRLFHVAPRVEILMALEGRLPQGADVAGNLALLPGRYAFLWTAGKVAAQSLDLSDVALQTQAPGNSLMRAANTVPSVDTTPHHPPK